MAGPLPIIIVGGAVAYEIHKHKEHEKKKAAAEAAAHAPAAGPAGPPGDLNATGPAGAPPAPGATVSSSAAEAQVNDSKNKLKRAIGGDDGSAGDPAPAEAPHENLGQKVKDGVGHAASATGHFFGGIFGHHHKAATEASPPPAGSTPTAGASTPAPSGPTPAPVGDPSPDGFNEP